MTKAVHPLKTYRDARGLSRGDLAEILKVSRITIFRWETGKRSPKRTMLPQIIEATEGALTYADFVEFEREGAA